MQCQNQYTTLTHTRAGLGVRIGKFTRTIDSLARISTLSFCSQECNLANEEYAQKDFPLTSAIRRAGICLLIVDAERGLVLPR